MDSIKFYEAFEAMRNENLGGTYDRRDLGLLALQYGIYFNSTMWACGLGDLFRKSRIGSRYVYTFKPLPTNIKTVDKLMRATYLYKHNDERKIAHAKAILRRYGIEVQ